MRCPRCQQENPEGGQFCIRCGLPLTPEAQSASDLYAKKQKRTSAAGRCVAGILKAVCYVLLFLLVQSAVIGIYGAYYTVGKMPGMLNGSYNMQDDLLAGLSEELTQAVYENISLLTLISGVLTILFLAIFFALRHKYFFAECGLCPVPLKTLVYCALAGAALNVVLSVSISLLPLPESWFTGLDEQYQYLGQGNLLLEILSTAVLTGLVEEVIFRGLSESRMRRGMPGWLSVILSALLFGVCHGTPIAIGYAAFLGAVFSLLNRRTGSILPSVVMHMFFNGTALFFVTDDPLLALSLYLICGGVLLGSLYLFVRQTAPAPVPAENEQNPSVQ